MLAASWGGNYPGALEFCAVTCYLSELSKCIGKKLGDRYEYTNFLGTWSDKPVP